MSKIEMRKQEEKWRVESDLRTLIEAECIRKDSKRLAAAQKLAKEQMMEVAAVATSDNDGDES